MSFATDFFFAATVILISEFGARQCYSNEIQKNVYIVSSIFNRRIHQAKKKQPLASVLQQNLAFFLAVSSSRGWTQIQGEIISASPHLRPIFNYVYHCSALTLFTHPINQQIFIVLLLGWGTITETRIDKKWIADEPSTRFYILRLPFKQ